MARIVAKRNAVPPNIFLERLFKPSISWEGESGNNSPDTTTLPLTEHSDTVGGSANETTPSAHTIMAVIAPWTEPFLAYLTRQELPEDNLQVHRIWRRTRLAMPKTIYAPDSSSLKPGSVATKQTITFGRTLGL